MRISFWKFVPVVAMLAALPIAASTHQHKSSAHKVVKVKQQVAGMSVERATEIQAALIQQGYLSGEPTGKWDSASVGAMQKLQSENGWQTKFTPDSRALIKLGLGSAADTAQTNTASLSPNGGR